MNHEGLADPDGWAASVQACLAAARSCVLVSVARTRGSAPREAGAWMLVSRERIAGTIGGGILEQRAIELARAQLDSEAAAAVRRFPLGPALGQCCGGVVWLVFERFAADDPDAGDLAALTGSGDPFARVTALDGARPGLLGYLTARDMGVQGSAQDMDVRESAQDAARDMGVQESAQNMGVQESQESAQESAPQPASQVAAREMGVQQSQPLPSGRIGTAGRGVWRPSPALLSAALATLARGDAELLHLGGCQYLLHASAPGRVPLYLFGAGHVGRALVSVLAALPFAVIWVDPRPEAFPSELPGNVTVMCRKAPAYAVPGAPAGAFYLIMSHSHALDLQICERVLGRGDARYCGLIGSLTKRRRFERQLQALAVDTGGLTCPIGVSGIEGKQPAQIAVAVAAELLQHLHRPAVPTTEATPEPASTPEVASSTVTGPRP